MMSSAITYHQMKHAKKACARALSISFRPSKGLPLNTTRNVLTFHQNGKPSRPEIFFLELSLPMAKMQLGIKEAVRGPVPPDVMKAASKHASALYCCSKSGISALVPEHLSPGAVGPA